MQLNQRSDHEPTSSIQADMSAIQADTPAYERTGHRYTRRRRTRARTLHGVESDVRRHEGASTSGSSEPEIGVRADRIAWFAAEKFHVDFALDIPARAP